MDVAKYRLCFIYSSDKRCVIQKVAVSFSKERNAVALCLGVLTETEIHGVSGQSQLVKVPFNIGAAIDSMKLTYFVSRSAISQ